MAKPAITPSAHVPGPWQMTVDSFGDVFRIVGTEGPYDGETVCTLADWSNEEEAMATARLIAAAPTLLDAAHVAANAIKRALLYETPGSAEHTEFQWALDTVHAAIAEAKGRG